MTKRAKWGIGIGAAAAVLAAAIAGLALLFDPVRLFPVPEVTEEDMLRQAEVIAAAAVQMRETAPVPGAAVTLRLTPAQVRSILHISLRQYALREGMMALPLQLDYRDDGRWEILYMHDTRRRWLFGGGLRLFLTGRFSVRGGVAAFAADSAAVGALRFSGAGAQWSGDAALAEIDRDESFADLVAAIREFYTDKAGDLVVSVVPEEFFWLMMKR